MKWLPNSRSGRKRLVRFIAIMGAVTLALLVIGCLEIALDYVDDDIRHYQPKPGFEIFLNALQFVIALPLAVIGSIVGGYLNKLELPGIVFCFFILIPGLFWATVVDLVMRAWHNRTAVRTDGTAPLRRDCDS